MARSMEKVHSGRTAGWLAVAAWSAAALVAGCAGAATGSGSTFRVHEDDISAATVALVRSDLGLAEARIRDLLGAFPDTVSVRLLPDRADFDAALRAAWGVPETACWMVGAAGDHVLFLLSPDAWEDEACEHDPKDHAHRRMLVAHEAVHVYHGQVNPSDDLGSLEDIGWFIEGLATYASGQLDARHAGRAAEALAAGQAPASLAEAWAGPYRYGVAGSMAAFIDDRWGRETLRRSLRATSAAELLGLLGVGEDEFLEEWRAWVESRSRSTSYSPATPTSSGVVDDDAVTLSSAAPLSRDRRDRTWWVQATQTPKTTIAVAWWMTPSVTGTT